MKTESHQHNLRTIRIALIVFFCAAAGMALQDSPDLPRIRVESALVTVPVIVKDSEGRFLPALSADTFTLYQDGIQTPISLFLTSEDPIKIALLLDSSMSTKSILKKIKQAAGRFLLQMRPQDLAMVVSFDSEVQVLCPLSSDQRELKEAIKQTKAGGSTTKMRDAINEIQLRLRAISGRKAIVLLSDGQDHGSLISPADLHDAIAASSTLIYSIFYRVDPRKMMEEMGLSSNIPESAEGHPKGPYAEWNKIEEQAAQYLERLSELSGGRSYRSNIGELDMTFKQISDELRSQYLLGFYPEQTKLDGAMHRLSVSVTIPDAVVSGRRSYRAVR
jgi:Ca-activated chloride channel homolog